MKTGVLCKKKITRTFRLSDGVLACLQAVSRRSGITMTALIERLVEKHLPAEAVIMAQERLQNLSEPNLAAQPSSPPATDAQNVAQAALAGLATRREAASPIAPTLPPARAGQKAKAVRR